MPAPSPAEWVALTDEQQFALASVAIGQAERAALDVAAQRADLDVLTRDLSDLRTSSAADVAALRAALDVVTAERDALRPPPDPARVAWDALDDESRWDAHRDTIAAAEAAGVREQNVIEDRRKDRREAGRLLAAYDGATTPADQAKALADLLDWVRGYGVAPRATPR